MKPSNMRRIRFKARSLKTNEMVEGFYALQHISKIDGFEEHYCIFNDEPGYRKGSYWTEIDPDTLCQQTGMDDMNMMPIWEHDMVKLFAPAGWKEAPLHEMIGEVIFKQTAYFLYFDDGLSATLAALRGNYDMQVICNLYETTNRPLSPADLRG